MSEVTALAFRDSLFNAFNTFWAGRTEIAAPNVDFDPDELPESDEAYVRLFIQGDLVGQTRLSNSIARAHFSEEGLFTIEVYVREGTDLDLAYQLGQAAQDFLSKPGVADSNFSNVSPPREIGLTGDGWFQVVVSAAWLYWTDRAA